MGGEGPAPLICGLYLLGRRLPDSDIHYQLRKGNKLG